MIQKFRKKPIVIEAMRWTGIETIKIVQWSNGYVQPYIAFEGNTPVETNYLEIKTLKGKMLADRGDWIIKETNSEFYPCKPEIFEKTYELINE